MKKLLFILLITIPFIGFGQYLEKIKLENLVGVKIKFLTNNSTSEYGYMNMGETKKCFPWLKYDDYSGRTGEIMSITKGGMSGDDDVIKIELSDNKDVVYMTYSDLSGFPKNLGIIDLLEEGKKMYIGRKFYKDFREVEIIDIRFSEDDGEKYNQLFGPIKVIYLDSLITKSWECNLTSTYTTKDYKGNTTNSWSKTEITYEHEVERIFEYHFKVKNPLNKITLDNLENHFFVEEDKMDDKITYRNKYLFHKNNLTKSKSGIVSFIIKTNNDVKMVIKTSYHNDDWLFHKYFKVLVGDEKKQSSLSNDRKEIVLDEGKVLEWCFYTDKVDLEIVKLISENWNDKIDIRYYGEFYIDRLIPLNVKMGIKETYELYKVLNK
jgi:hypothetical protein